MPSICREEPFARSDLYDSMDNLGMYWHLPNIQAFHSIVPASIMEFYPQVGVKRDVSSKPGIEYFPLALPFVGAVVLCEERRARRRGHHARVCILRFGAGL